MPLKEYRGLFLENVKVWLLFPSYRNTDKNKKTLSEYIPMVFEVARQCRQSSGRH